MASLSFNRVSLTYEGSDRQVRALDELTLDVADGESVAIIGPSGCGKSTLLLLAAGLLRPDGAGGAGGGAVASAPTAATAPAAAGTTAAEGRVTIAGEPVVGPRRETALILQDFGLLPWKTVAENAGLGLQIRRLSKNLVRERAADALERVGLSEFASAYPSELSGGMRQRLALARAVALDADLLLMDEPLSALDALKREELQSVLLELWKRRGHTSVLVTHSIEEAVFLGQRVVVMTPRPGRVAAIVDNPSAGTPEYRSSEEFFARCTQLRSLLAEEGAL